jgi:hypothetical protein
MKNTLPVLQTIEYDGLDVEFYVKEGVMHIESVDGQGFDADDETHAEIAEELAEVGAA